MGRNRSFTLLLAFVRCDAGDDAVGFPCAVGCCGQIPSCLSHRTGPSRRGRAIHAWCSGRALCRHGVRPALATFPPPRVLLRCSAGPCSMTPLDISGSFLSQSCRGKCFFERCQHRVSSTANRAHAVVNLDTMASSPLIITLSTHLDSPMRDANSRRRLGNRTQFPPVAARVRRARPSEQQGHLCGGGGNRRHHRAST